MTDQKTTAGERYKLIREQILLMFKDRAAGREKEWKTESGRRKTIQEVLEKVAREHGAIPFEEMGTLERYLKSLVKSGYL